MIYYYWRSGLQFWLFTLYDQDELDDLSSDQRKQLKALLEREVKTNESVLDLPENEKPQGSPVFARSQKLESTVRYLGIEVDDALQMAEQMEV